MTYPLVDLQVDKTTNVASLWAVITLSDLRGQKVLSRFVWDFWSGLRPHVQSIDFMAEGRGVTLRRACGPERHRISFVFAQSCGATWDRVPGHALYVTLPPAAMWVTFCPRNATRPTAFTLKQCVFCSPSQMVRGSGNFLRMRYFSTGPSGWPRSLSASR